MELRVSKHGLTLRLHIVLLSYDRCILYELAMLRSPFKEEGLNLYSLFGKITKGDFPPISEVYSKELRDLVDRMLLTDPTQRIDIDVRALWRLRRYSIRLSPDLTCSRLRMFAPLLLKCGSTPRS